MEEIVKKRFPFFESGLGTAISEAGTYREFEENRSSSGKTSTSGHFPSSFHGLIKVCRTDDDGNELLLYYMRPGEVCTVSLICCMDRTRSRVKAITEEETTAILIPGRTAWTAG